MLTLKEVLKKATQERWAVPHFNFANSSMLEALVQAAVEARSPLLVGTSESERDFIGLEQCVALVKSYRDEHDMPIYLNADHTHSVEKAKEAIDAGYDSIHIDLSKESFENNLKGTKEVVDYAKSKNPEISVEGEIGYLVTDSSTIYKDVVDVPKDSLAKPEEAKKFVDETGVNRLAPAVGSIHGIAANKPHLDFKLISTLRDLLGDTAFVLHGGSGVTEDEMKKAIQSGISNVHISTDLRVAFVDKLREELEKHKDEYKVYKLLKPEIEQVKKVALYNIELFGSSKTV